MWLLAQLNSYTEVHIMDKRRVLFYEQAACYDNKESLLLVLLWKLMCNHWRQTMAYKGQGYAFFLSMQEELSCEKPLASAWVKFLNYVWRHSLGQSQSVK